jgi:uncharacterized protein YwgA
MSDLFHLAQLLHDLGSVERGKIESIVHVLQVGGADFELSYELSVVGIHSTELNVSLHELIAAHLVEVKEEDAGRVRYSSTRRLTNVLEKADRNEPAQWADLARELNQEDVSNLEGIGIICFLESRGWSDSDLFARFQTLKPNLSERFEQLRDKGRKIKARKIRASR